jgi:hypothetical protein
MRWRLVRLFVLFLCSALPALAEPSWNWRSTTENARVQSSVRIENLHFGDIPVEGARRKLYRGIPVDRDLGIEKFSVDTSVWNQTDRGAVQDKLSNRFGFERSRGVRWELREALLFSHSTGRLQPVWEARPVSDQIQYLFVDYLDPRTGELVWRKPLYRRLSAKVYPTSPYNGGSNDAPAEFRTLPGLTGLATQLSTGYMTVKRQQFTSGFDALDVDPNQDFENEAGFDLQPSSYNSSCTGSGALSCPNQAFDAVNVFYHVQGYREYIETLFAGIDETVTWAEDPIMVVVNAIGYDVDGDGQTSDETNNAFYSSFCTVDSYQGGCLLFNPPDAESYSGCGGLKDYYDLAREALVAVHEYQHYVTDHLTGMVRGASGPNVGDLLHEGYSDYFAVSHVSRTAATPNTTILEYGFQECPLYQRALGTLKVYDKDSSRTDPHFYGWTWASGLYSLQASLGVQVVDKIALKSLFFLPTNPTFLDAVEALVQADASLNDGVNASTIRTLFFDTLRFVGGSGNPFADVGQGVVNVGVSSCLSTSTPPSATSLVASFGMFLIWFASVLFGARTFFGTRVR